MTYCPKIKKNKKKRYKYCKYKILQISHLTLNYKYDITGIQPTNKHINKHKRYQ